MKKVFIAKPDCDAPAVIAGIQDQVVFDTNLYKWSFGRNSGLRHAVDKLRFSDGNDLLVLKDGIVLIRLGAHLTLIADSEEALKDFARGIGMDPRKLQLEEVEINQEATQSG